MKTKHFKSRHALLMSLTSLMLCVSMLFGATFAWFTDSVTSGVNRIVSGNLDVEVSHTNQKETDEPVDDLTTLFDVAADDTTMLWEPGAMSYEIFKVKNVGNLALKYQLSLSTVDYNTVTWTDTNKGSHDLREVLQIAVVKDGGAEKPETTAFKSWASYNGTAAFSGNLAANGEETYAVYIWWPNTNSNDTDNLYNLNNASRNEWLLNKLNDGEQSLYVDLGVVLVATQDTVENDSFDKLYDQNSVYPGASISNASGVVVNAVSSPVPTTVIPSGSDMSVSAVNLSAGNIATAEVQDNTGITLTDTSNNATYTVTTDDDVKLQLTVTSTDETGGNLVVATSQSSQSYDVDMSAIVTTTTTEGVGESATTTTSEKTYKVASTQKVFIVTLNVGDVDLTGFYHNGNPMIKVDSVADVDADGEYYYANGVITFATTSFSPFTATYKFAGGLGTDADHPYLIETREQMQAISNEYENGYAYYKWVGASTLDCDNWKAIKLFGSFDGNNANFYNLDQCMFQFIGLLGEGNSLDSWSDKDAVIENFTATFDLETLMNVAGALCFQVNGRNTTTFKNVTVAGNVVCGANGGAFVAYTSGNWYDTDLNFGQKLAFEDCHVTATLVSTSGNIGIVAGFITYCNQGIILTVSNPDSIFTGNVSTVGGKAFLKNNVGAYPAAGSTEQKEYTCTKLVTKNPTKTDEGYAVEKTENAVKVSAFISAQLTETDAQGNKTAVAGITMNLSKLGMFSFGDNSSVKVLDSINSFNFANKQETYSASLSNGVLSATTGGTNNFTCGDIRLTVVQYDENGAVVSTGNLNIVSASSPDAWTVK